MKRVKTPEIRFYRSSGEYGFLSNLFRCSISFEGRHFISSEHAYQFGKPNKPAIAEWLAAAPMPRLCALAAHALLPYDVMSNWNDTKLARMEAVLRAKFVQNLDLREKLLATGSASLIEESNDNFWGSGPILGETFHGHNHLGSLLVKIRMELGGLESSW